MNNYKILITIICTATILVSMIFILRSVYTLVSIDAKRRHIKSPKMWGALSLLSNNSSGIILYLIKRRNYPIIEFDDNINQIMLKNKKIFTYGMILFSSAFILIILNFTLL